jgi:hypothetical protein
MILKSGAGFPTETFFRRGKGAAFFITPETGATV